MNCLFPHVGNSHFSFSSQHYNQRFFSTTQIHYNSRTNFIEDQENKSTMGLIKSAIGDAILTFTWVFTTPLLGVLISVVSSYLAVEPKTLPSLFITINLATLRLYMFTFIAALLGGASFNPTAALSLYTAGLKPDASLMSMAVRFPAEAAGAVAGAVAILKSMPVKYKHMVKGLSLNVELQTGAMIGVIFSFLYCFSLIFVLTKGPKNLLVKLWLLACARVSIGIVVNSVKQTGIIMNPASAYGWAYLSNWHNNWDFFCVYWICPFIGAVLAAWFFRFMFRGSIKAKQA
ncbi:aquaporin SIP1-1-like [Mercurialis annua]|uniref:aquaporin SIP1-1-like n=1 Tax=Mercurialis annua TaxID=3986 RepID=UPI002160CC8D|nr:aquaporin SIP1-1-like [Mercurialis annua]